MSVTRSTFPNIGLLLGQSSSWLDCRTERGRQARESYWEVERQVTGSGTRAGVILPTGSADVRRGVVAPGPGSLCALTIDATAYAVGMFLGTLPLFEPGGHGEITKEFRG